MSIASSLGLAVDDAIVLQDSNRLTVRLLPCDMLARVAYVEHQVAQFEIELAQRLAGSGSPVAALEPRVEPRVYERDGFAVTLWTYGAAEQLLHGEPHPGNVLTTKSGLLFIDLETCCRGPVEFDLAHTPEEVSEHYTDVSRSLLSESTSFPERPGSGHPRHCPGMPFLEAVARSHLSDSRGQ